MDSFKNRYTCERKEGRRFHERPTDLPLQFHFSSHANRNRIGQWTRLVPLAIQKLIFSAEFFHISHQIVGDLTRCNPSQELFGVYVQ